MALARQLLNLLREMAAAHDPTQFIADYQVTTPRGVSARFTRRGSLMNMRNAPQSETAVLAYLKKLHPQCEIQINRLEFR